VSLPPDKELIAELLDQNNELFGRLTDQWYSTMYYIAASIAGDSIADEVVQEAWISVMRALPKFEGRSSLKSWVMRIVSNEAKTRRRKESRSVSLEQMEESWATDPRFSSNHHWSGNSNSQWHGESPEQLVQANELNDCIEKHIKMLPDNQRSALMLKESQSHSLEEICNILDVSSSNVRVLLHRARDKILQMVERFEREGQC
jgi:RNA polymerase sigma-70 factor (ECF subfamily)